MTTSPRVADPVVQKAAQLDREGYAQAPSVLTATECAEISTALSHLGIQGVGTRCRLAQPWCAALANRLRRHAALVGCVPAGSVAVQCTVFAKSQQTNGLVPLHQDLSVPVARRVPSPRWRGWAHKEGALFAQPPQAVLAQMVALRLHLDDCGACDGPLWVRPGSHLDGAATPQRLTESMPQEVRCDAQAGDVLVMKPLLWHRSSKATGGSRRRVLHFLFGPAELPDGAQWAQAV